MRHSLTEREMAMLDESASEIAGWETSGNGVELRGSGDWRVARALVRRELGWIEGGRPNGSELPGLFFANSDGLDWVREPDQPEDEDGDW